MSVATTALGAKKRFNDLLKKSTLGVDVVRTRPGVDGSADTFDTVRVIPFESAGGGGENVSEAGLNTADDAPLRFHFAPETDMKENDTLVYEGVTYKLSRPRLSRMGDVKIKSRAEAVRV